MELVELINIFMIPGCPIKSGVASQAGIFQHRSIWHILQGTVSRLTAGLRTEPG